MQAIQERFTDLVHNDRERKQPLSALPGFDASRMKEGYLQKKGQRFKSWKRRWFVCNGRTLSYYISRKDRKPNAVIPLESCSVEDGGLSETWNSPRINLTDGTTGVVYCLSAEEAEMVTAWLSVLRTAIARLGSSSRDPRATAAPAGSAAIASSAATTTTATTSSANGRAVKTLANYTDDDEPDGSRFKRQLQSKSSTTSLHAPRTALLVSGDSVVDAGAAASKRTARLASGPPHLGARGARTKTVHQPTTISLENELASGLDLLETLLSGNASSSSHRQPHSHGIVFRPIGAANGVLRSIGSATGTSSSSSSSSRKLYARASAVLPVPSEVAAFYITDHGKRALWDIQFPHSSHVASFDESTELLHLTGDGFQQITSTRPFVAAHVAGAVSALFVGSYVVSASSSWEATCAIALVAGLVAVVLTTVDYSAVCGPRDLLLLRHVRESSVLEKRPPSVSELLENDGDDTPPIVTILEKSVVSELRQPSVSTAASTTAVRAHIGLSGWLLEPVDRQRTRATYVTDLDARGFVSSATKTQFRLDRLDCVAVLRELLTQSHLCSEALLLMDGDRGSMDGGDDRDDDDREDDDDRDGDDSVAYQEERGHGEDDAGRATARDAFHPSVYMNGMMQIPSGGLKLVDKDVARKQGGVLKDVIKSAGAKMLEGKGTVSLSLPVRIFEPRTNLERIVDLFLYGPTFLNAAADASSDPLERFKLVMSFAVAGMHHSVGQLKPFNPILGETYQSVLNDGTDVCCEHTSHHPPISNFQLVGAKYALDGYILWHGSFSMKSNAVIQNNHGPIRVAFNDGAVVSYNLPVMQSGGFLWGDRTVELVGSVLFEDATNHLMCELRFNPDEKKGMGGMFSAAKTPSDHVRGVIVNTATGAELCDVAGSWLEELRFGGKPYWVYGREHSGYTLPVADDKLLVSDSRNREDLRYLAAEELDTAQDWKVRLEVLQRADRKVRTDGRRANHWSFKDDKQTH